MRRLITVAALTGVVALVGTGCGDSHGWEPSDLSQAGVIETLTCDQASQAIDTVSTALHEQDPEALSALGVTNSNKAGIQGKLTAHKVEACSGASLRTQEQAVEVVANDGSRSQLPVVADNGRVVNGDSTREADTPPVAARDLLQQCGTLQGWDQLVACMGNERWYMHDGMNTMTPYTHFTADDVQRWSTAKDVNGKPVEARIIHVFNMEISDADARNAVRAMIGPDADKLPIVRHGEFVNSRGLEKERVSPFVDRKQQVRVALAPLVLNEHGQAIGLRGDAGVFVDCLNIWGMPFSVASAPGQPAVCPPNSGMAGKPIPGEGPRGCNPPPPSPPVPPRGCVDCTTTPPPPPGRCESGCNNPGKDPTKDPAQQGHAPVGGGRNEDPGPGVRQPYTPPPAAPYTPPAVPSAPARPPTGSTPVPNPQPPPPPETGANPPGGGGNDGDPGEF